MKRTVSLTVVLGLAALVLAAGSGVLAGGGGSNAVYTLDPVSWSIINNSAVPYLPADIFVDDPRRIDPGTLPPLAFLTQDLTFAGLAFRKPRTSVLYPRGTTTRLHFGVQTPYQT